MTVIRQAHHERSEDISIREGGVDDAATIAMLFTEFNGLLGADGLPAAGAFRPENLHVASDQMARRLTAIAGVEKTLLATVRGEPAGMLCLRLVPYIGQDAPYAEVTQLYVRQTSKRRGIGAALLDAAERIAVDAGATCVHIITGRDNIDAQAFYRARGYDSEDIVFDKYFRQELSHA